MNLRNKKYFCVPREQHFLAALSLLTAVGIKNPKLMSQRSLYFLNKRQEQWKVSKVS